MTRIEGIEPSNYFLYKDQFLDSKLSKIFKKNKKLSFDSTKMRSLGFKILPRKNKNKILIGFHNELKGFLVKFYNNDKGQIDELNHFKKRIDGALLIQEYISKNKLENIFKVPKKWIWKIPTSNEERYLLIVEDMNLLDSEANKIKWKKDNFDIHFFKKLYCTIKELGLLDSLYIDNIPFSKDGRIAFIDTEHYLHKHIRYNILSYYLSKKNRTIWESISQE